MDIRAENLTVRFGPATILDGVSLSLNGGEVVGLIGPNGAGKTTLLRALAGLLKASDGAIHYDGKSAAEMGRTALARRLSFWPRSATSIGPCGSTTSSRSDVCRIGVRSPA